jgi:hypothetical protein
MPLQTADVELLMNNARIHLSGSSDTGIKTELFNAMSEFLKDSNSWIEHVRLPVTAGTQEYLVTPPGGGQIIRLVEVRDGNWFPVNAAMPSIPTLTSYQPVQMTTPPVSAGDTTLGGDKPWWILLVKNIMLPQTKDQLPIAPSFLLQRYQEAITSGVISRMMLQPQKTYSNIPLAQYHGRKFRDGIQHARQEAWTQNLFGGQRWRFPQSYRTNNQRGGSVATWPSETF